MSAVEPVPVERAARSARPWKALIKVGYACNNHCTFCHTLDWRDLDGTGPLVMKKIERARALGYSMVVLSGGEVTMRKELLLWAARTASLGMDFGLVTNGRMLAYRDLVAKLLRLRLRYVYLSLHGGEARVHNSLVRADAFAETVAAIKNLVGHGLDFTVNTVVTRQNVRHLRAVVDLLLPIGAGGDLTLKFSMVQPKGGADLAFQSVIPDVEEAAERIRDAIAHGMERVHQESGRGPRFAHDGVPLCLLPGLEELYDDLQTHGFASMTEAFEPDFFPVDDADKVQPEPCRGCALAGPCPGLYRTTHELRGAAMLRPVRAGARSNSFTYTPDRVLAKGADGGCPIYDSPLPYHLGRHLLLDAGDRVVVHHTASRDFSEVEIAHVKRDLGQLYLDRSGKPAPDDFPADLVRLSPAPMCRGCDRRERCAGAFVPIAEDVFSPAEFLVRSHLELCGRIIDVGCGEGRHGDLLAAAAEAGRIAYLGVEPDPERAASLAARWPWATVRACLVEALPADDLASPVDALLVLRSWNHLARPAEALAPLIRALRPGGTLLVVDNVAFGLVRTRDQQRRASTSTAGWEHHRNDDSHAALDALASFSLDVVAHHPVTPDGANQWLLALRRR